MEMLANESVNSMFFSSPLIYHAVCGCSLLFDPCESQLERHIGTFSATHGHVALGG